MTVSPAENKETLAGRTSRESTSAAFDAKTDTTCAYLFTTLDKDWAYNVPHKKNPAKKTTFACMVLKRKDKKIFCFSEAKAK